MLTDNEIAGVLTSALNGVEVSPMNFDPAVAAKRRRHHRRRLTGAAIAGCVIATVVSALAISGGTSVHTNKHIADQARRRIANYWGPLAGGCPPPASLTLVSNDGLTSTDLPIINSTGSAHVVASLAISRSVIINKLQLVVGTPGSVAVAGGGNAPPLKGSNAGAPISQIAVDEVVNATNGTQLTVDPNNLASGTYPIFGYITYSDVQSCGAAGTMADHVTVVQVLGQLEVR